MPQLRLRGGLEIADEIAQVIKKERERERYYDKTGLVYCDFRFGFAFKMALCD